jgi:UDP-glucose 4-epimerase
VALKVLVTGASGALGGASVLSLMAAGHSVVGCGRELGDGVYARWDIASEDGPEPEQDADVVVHAAALRGGYRQSLEGSERLFDVNVTGTLRVVRWCISHGVSRLVLVSGAIVYGEWDASPKSEADDARPWAAGPYAVSKWSSEQVARLVGDHGLELTILRFSSLYGVAYGDGLPQRLLIEGKREGAIVVTPPTDDAFDLLHVSDAARTVRLAVESPRTGLWNAGSGTRTTIAALAEVCSRQVSCEVQYSGGTAPRTPRVLNWVDDDKARTELGHANEITLDVGVAEIVHGF